VRGELRLAEGHIARINNSATEAVQDFNDAHDLLPNSPDPYIGLARAYLEGFKDLDKARDAYKNAEKRGYALGNRDKWQLAEAFRDRAERLWWDTRTVRGLPQEKEQLQRAQQDYQSALDLYQEIAPFGNSSAQIVRVQADSESVRNRLQQIADEAGLGLFR
jgi:TPR repeat protein